MTQIIKVGGNELDDPDFVKTLVTAVKRFEKPPVLVHGGGKEIRHFQERLGLTPTYVEGLRVTDADSLAIAQMVLAGLVNKRLVAALNAEAVDAFGLCGVDRGIIRARRMLHPKGDLGWVGEVTGVKSEILLDMLNHGTTPVMSPICGGEDGVVYNVNADHVAEALALALAADALVFVSNVPGVQIDGQLVEHLAPSDVEQLIDQGIISGGMIPKTRSALGAVSRGVTAVRITNLQGLASGTGTVIS